MPLPSAYNPKNYETEIYQEWLKNKVGSPKVEGANIKGASGLLKKAVGATLVSDFINDGGVGEIESINGGGGIENVGIGNNYGDAEIENAEIENNYGDYGDAEVSSTGTYCVVVPPPNLTGDLHMGHAFEHYLMDTLARIARQQGKSTLYYPGVDHAGIQLEGVINKFINKGEFDEEIRSLGTKYSDFFEIPEADRANFLKQNFSETWLKFAWSKVDIWRGNQLKQAEKLGDTPDFERLLFTLDPRAINMVDHAFIKYWQDGLIHKGSYLINWSVALQTALSDVPEDISHEERKDPFITFEYEVVEVSIIIHPDRLRVQAPIGMQKIIDSKSKRTRIKVSTVRPETIAGDVAIAIHPDKIAEIFSLSEEEAKSLISHLNNEKPSLSIELSNPVNPRRIILLVDNNVEKDFGTGALKITPAHDQTDYDIANKHGIHNLPQAVGRDGKLTNICGEFAGLTVEQGRMAVIKRLIEDGYVPTKDGFEENRESVPNKPSVEKLSDPEFRNLSLEKQKEYLQKNYPQFQVDWNYVHNVVICERSKTVVEPLISEEFFIDYYKEFVFNPIKPFPKLQKKIEDFENKNINTNIEIIKPGQKTTLQKLALMGIEQTNFYPSEYKERAINYFETIKNWCISRDLIWGHKMPVWYNLDTNPEKIFLSAEQYKGSYFNDEPQNMFFIGVEKPLTPGDWVQETKILDTWFSSTLWPLTTLNFLDYSNNKTGTDFEKFYPTQTMTTAKEIFYAWIVRMIMTGVYFTGYTPFENYLAHAWVLDDKGKKMSKSLGNVIDVADQIDKFSSDAVRLGMLEKSIPGRNIRFGGKLGDSASEKYRNFGNKLWNVARFLEGKEGEIGEINTEKQ